MNIQPQPDDAPEFISLVENAVNGILRRYSPPALVLIKIDNWFGSRWLGFEGKLIGLAGVRLKTWKGPASTARIAIPPFVPERVASQRSFAAPEYEETAPGEPVHIQKPGRWVLRHRAALTAPEKALIWYCGNSKANGRGSLMAYLPLDSSYWPWFVEIEMSDPWRVTESWGIKVEDFSSLVLPQGQSAASEGLVALR